MPSLEKAGVEILHTKGTLSVENFESSPKTVEIFDRLPGMAPANIRIHGKAEVSMLLI